MNMIELYDQLTTTWEKARANILSHFIALLLLWLVGFSLPFPDFGIADLDRIVQHPLYEHLKGVGLLALASLCSAIAIGVYALLLREAGRLVLNAVFISFPPDIRDTRILRRARRRSLFIVAATLDPGEYQPRDIRLRLNDLVGEFALAQPDEFKSLPGEQAAVSKDSTTHFQNASVFLIMWILAAIFLSDDSQMGKSVDAVFWRGFGALLVYLLISYRRLVTSFDFVILQLVDITARLVASDPNYAEKLLAARRSPAPFLALVDAYRRSEPEDVRPSLRYWLKSQLSLKMRSKAGSKGKNGFSEHGTAEEQETFFARGRRFEWDTIVNRDYEDPFWPLHYARWRAGRIVVFLERISLTLLMMLGLRRLK